MFLILRGCEVSKKRKTSGTFNDIGSLELHKKHEVILEEPEDEAIGRARVADQKMIDRLLLDDYIDMNQHKAGEYLLTAAVNAGLFVKTPNLMAVGGGGSKDIYNYGILKLSRIMNLMGREIGQSGAEMVVNVVCDDRPVNADELLILKVGLDLIDRRYLSVG